MVLEKDFYEVKETMQNSVLLSVLAIFVLFAKDKRYDKWNEALFPWLDYMVR